MAKTSRTGGSKGPSAPSTTAGSQPTGPVQATPSAKSAPSSDNFGQAAKGLLSFKSSPLVSGAMKIFGDNVILPSGLTDSQNPQNDAKYFRLLSAVLGLDELESYFQTLEGDKKEEYLAHKADQRERRLEKLAREKEEKRKQKESEEPEED